MTLPSKLFHYSVRIIDKLVPEYYDEIKKHWIEEGSMKPSGLWVSVEEYEDDYSWFDWCKGEQFRLEELKYKYSVKLDSDTKILHLKSKEDILKFSLDYAANDPFDFARKSSYQRTKTYVYMISWNKVKAEYDGIMIAPYQWKCRLAGECSWYYPWDCSSACIWNLDKISLELHSEIDIESITDKEESVELEEEESVKDSQSANLALLP